jgi:hypothetical protein
VTVGIIVALVLLAVADGLGFAVVGYLAKMQRAERAEWASERRQLVDRAIARHTGEIIALDKSDKGTTPRPPAPERLVEGLS